MQRKLEQVYRCETSSDDEIALISDPSGGFEDAPYGHITGPPLSFPACPQSIPL